MAYIRKIHFDSVGEKEGCTCDRCVQYIKNIWTVTYHDGVSLHFGIDCFEKLSNEKLTNYGMKLMKKALKKIEFYQEELEKFKALTEETDLRWQATQKDELDAWYGSSYEEYRAWMLDTWYPTRFAEAQKEIDKFSKVNFSR